MVKSMFAGVAGLKAHQSKMDVIGNNIANVNTWGYKSYSYNFMDSIYTTSINSSGGVTTAGGMGGRNPSQVGYGSQMASISFQYTTGAPSPSDNELDCMIDGTGLFLVGGMINGGITDVKSSGLYLSRVGIFSPDNNGYIVDSQKNYVYGYALKEGTGIPETPATQATATVKNAEVTFNTDDPDNMTMSIGGKEYKVTSKVFSQALTQWFKAANAEENEKIENNTPPGEVAGSGALSYNMVSYNSQAKTVNLSIVSREVGAAGNAYVNDGTVAGFTGANVSSEITEGTDYKAGIDPVFEETLSPIQIPIDPDTYTQYNIQSWSMSELGVITGIDVKNRPIVLGQLCLVAVENPNGLVKTNGYYFSVGDNAGEVEAMAPDGGQVGSIRSKMLEMANTDLANEFSNMITTQRGFQANSKIITVTDEMLQELVNMKR